MTDVMQLIQLQFIPDLYVVHAYLTNQTQNLLEDTVEECGHRALFLQVQPNGLHIKKPQLPRWNFKRANWTAFEQTSNKLFTLAS